MKYVLLILFISATSCAASLDEDRLADIIDLQPDVSNGEALYTGECERCHGPLGNGDGIGPPLDNNSFTNEDVARNMLRGPFAMPTYSDYFDQEIADVAEYVVNL